MCHAFRVSSWRIVPVPEGCFDNQEPLWRALYDHHNQVTPHLHDRSRTFEQSWPSRRRTERRWLESEPDSFVLAAQEDDRYIGYALVRIRSSSGFADSWTFSDPLAFLATLVVLPSQRGQGIGSALMDAVEAKLSEMGITDMIIEVVTTNTDAIRLYERRGAVPFVAEYVQRLHPS
jgi:ribosomal protein S18 acetylase RimI-like enzyme